jgi:hypothetical protein
LWNTNSSFSFWWYVPTLSPTGATEEYDGSTWTTVNPGSMNTVRTGLVGVGTQTAALAFGGSATPTTAATEEYDGTSWTSNSIIHQDLLAGAGIQTAALAFGGYTSRSLQEQQKNMMEQIGQRLQQV